MLKVDQYVHQIVKYKMKPGARTYLDRADYLFFTWLFFMLLFHFPHYVTQVIADNNVFLRANRILKLCSILTKVQLLFPL